MRRALLAKDAGRGHPNRFITLTSHRKQGVYPVDAARQLVDAWRRARRIMMKEFGWKTLPFFAFIEKTKLGWPHLHILARCGYINQKYLSALMNRLIGSPVVHITRIKGVKHAVRYVTKYVTKATVRFGTLKRYWRSKDYCEKPKEKYKDKLEWDEIWQVSTADVMRWSLYVWAQGFTVQDRSECRCVARRPP